MNIQYVKQDQLDRAKWDRCIAAAFNGSVFGFSWYLDIVSDDWDALVGGNYETVMPLPYQNSANQFLITHSPFVPQLGVFSTGILDSSTVETFISCIPANFTYIKASLNKHNQIRCDIPGISLSKSQELDLISHYKKLQSTYHDSVTKGIKDAIVNRVTTFAGLQPNEIMSLDNKQKQSRKHTENTRMLQQIISTAILKKTGEIYGAYSRENELVSAAFFIWSHQKVSMLYLARSDSGKKLKAAYLLLDSFIKMHSEKNLTLSFDYPEDKELFGFYKGFGAQEYMIPVFTRNDLPWHIRLLKKNWL
jgi:lipid II:glycine glycyltransferase (peptidoglycan interpeptide bridge formation enzyme)